MPQSYVSMHLHLVFSTKHRLPQIQPTIQQRLFQYIGGILQPQKSILIAAGGMPDHVHLMVSLGKEIAVSDLMRLIKTNSSKWVHETFPDQHDFAWQAGYGAFSVSYSNFDTVKRYIANQEQHHRRLSFQDEFRALLEKHHIEFEERYLWE